MQEFQPLCRHLQDEILDAGDLATRPGEARDKTSFDRVCADAEDDRDRRARAFRRGRNEGVVERGDDRHATADNVRHQQRQPIELTVQPALLNRYISVLDITSFAEVIAERIHREE
jgi:hypothetical protein